MFIGFILSYFPLIPAVAVPEA